MPQRMLAGLSVLVAILAAAPWWMPPWMLFIASGALAKGMAALGLMLLLRGGLVSFGHALYFGIGAYAAGLLVLSGITEFLVLAVLGTLATLVLAIILGAFVSRYRGIFFGLLSMALSMVFYGLLIKLQSLGSSDGFNLGGIHLLSIPMQGTAGQVPTYLMTLVLSVLAAIGIDKFVRSRYGLLTKALRDNELRVEYLGQSVRQLVLLNYVIAAGLAGLAGVLSAVAVGHIGPEMAYWTTSGEFVFMVILGGLGHVAAAFIGAGVLSAVQAVAYAVAPNSWQFIVGASLLACIVFLPEGLWSLLKRVGRRA